jgi:bifunctional DNase/RNase
MKMGDDWTEVTIRGVVIDPMTGDPTVLLEDHDATAIIAVPSDPSAAGALISELEGIEQDRSQALLYRFFVRHGVGVERVELSHNRDGRLAAYLRYVYEGDAYGIEVRPVDGLLIATQTNAPVYADGELIRTGETSAAPRVLEGSDLLILSRRTAQ